MFKATIKEITLFKSIFEAVNGIVDEIQINADVVV